MEKSLEREADGNGQLWALDRSAQWFWQLGNPEKSILKFTADATRTGSHGRNDDGVLFTREPLMRCGVVLNLNGIWEER